MKSWAYNTYSTVHIHDCPPFPLQLLCCLKCRRGRYDVSHTKKRAGVELGFIDPTIGGMCVCVRVCACVCLCACVIIMFLHY